MKSKLFISLFVLLSFTSNSQTSSKIIAGPMLGHTEFRTSEIWLQFAADIREAKINYQNQNGKTGTVEINLTGGGFNTGRFLLTGLEPGNIYSYTVSVNNKATVVANGKLTTQTLWQHRRQPAIPDFSFITGSCAYFNEAVYDRPGKPYGGDSSIFEQMAKEEAAFALWLGDNWYTREVDYFSNWGLHYRASRDRSLPVFQNLLKKMPQYAIWDDHDYGPNDADKSYVLKETSREVFKKYWSNPSYGNNGQGIYTKFTWNDADIFMLDGRWFRSNDATPDSIDGNPNANKKMFGDEQMEWLKNNLLVSNNNTQINFRIIAAGSQVLNSFSPYDCFRHFPVEYDELLNFLQTNNIKGVLFVTGDRHHSEIIKTTRVGTYPLYDITVSPFTSGISKTSGKEAVNPQRVGKEIDEQNYARFVFTGQGKERKLTVQFIGLNGQQIDEWMITKMELEK